MKKTKEKSTKIKVACFILFTLIFILGAAAQTQAQTYAKLSAKDSILAFIATDLLMVQRLVGADYENRKIYADKLFEEIKELRDSLLSDADFIKAVDDIRDSLLTSDNTFSGTNTFSDSLLATSRQWFTYLNPYNATSFIGDFSNPFLRMYSKNFVLVNSGVGAADTAYIELNDGKIVFGGDIRLIDSTKSIGSSAAGEQARSVWTDSVNANYSLTIRSVNRSIQLYSIVGKRKETIPVDNSTTSLTVTTPVLELQPTNTATIDTIHISSELLDGYTEEITIYNRSAYAITFTDNQGAGFTGCMRLPGASTNVVLNQYDVMKLIFYENSQWWLYSGGSDND